MSSAILIDTLMSKAMLVSTTLILERKKVETLTVVSSSLSIKLKNILIETLICRTNMELVVDLPSRKPLKTTLTGAISTTRILLMKTGINHGTVVRLTQPTQDTPSLVAVKEGYGWDQLRIL
jgi:hypothetical protein